MFKKAISLLLCVAMMALAALAAPTSVFAQEVEVETVELPASSFDSARTDTATFYTVEQFVLLSEILEEAFLGGQYTFIDISSVNVSSELLKNGLIGDVLDYLKGDICELLRLDKIMENNSYNYSLTSRGGIALSVSFTINNSSTYEENLAEFEAYITALAANIPQDLSDEEKVLWVYTYIVQNFEYDLTYDIHDPYQFIKTGAGVCEAYTLLFNAVMEKLGIESMSVYHDGRDYFVDSTGTIYYITDTSQIRETSDKVRYIPYNGVNYLVRTESGHTWNLVKIGDKWYHVDTTQGDSLASNGGVLSDIFAAVNYDFLLVTSDKLDTLDSNSRTEDHADYYTYDSIIRSYYGETVTEGGDDFADRVWTSMKQYTGSALTYCGGSWYFAKYDNTASPLALYRTDDLISKTCLLTRTVFYRPVDVNGKIMTNYFYPRYYGNVFTLGSYVCISTTEDIQYYNTKTGRSGTLSVSGLSASDTSFIHGVRYNGHGTVTVELKSNPTVLSSNADIVEYRVSAMASGSSAAGSIRKYLLGLTTLDSFDNWGFYDLIDATGLDILDLVAAAMN